MQILYPIGFLALAGLIIPVLLHLWSQKQGKTIKIGSIAFLGENSTTSSKSPKLTDLLLFILRCLLVMLIAFFLAQPYLKSKVKPHQNNGWVLMDKAHISEIYRSHRVTIDSLTKLGFELHDFNLGFNKISLNDSILAKDVPLKLNYTSLLNQLTTEIPSGYSAFLFADRRLVNFDGNLSPLNFSLSWKEVKYSDTVKNWSSAFLGKVYQAKSTPSLTIYRADSSQNLPAIKVMIYDPKNTDSKYIHAALSAIVDYTKRKIERINSTRDADVIFWLSEQPVKKMDVKAEARIFSYQKGKLQTVNSTLQVVAAPNPTISLNKRVAFTPIKGKALWMDGYGEPILLKENNNFLFYSRFNPQWTDLVWDEQFVKALIPIVLGDKYGTNFGFEEHDADQRWVSRIPFESTKSTASALSTPQRVESIDKLIWVLAFIVLVIERLLSFRHKNIRYAKS